MPLPPSKPTKHAYRRNLPHFQGREGSWLFITFATMNRWILPESVRDDVMEHCLFDDGRRPGTTSSEPAKASTTS